MLIKIIKNTSFEGDSRLQCLKYQNKNKFHEQEKQEQQIS